MDSDVFQANCSRTAIYRENMKSLQERMSYVTLGMASEAGEVCGKVKKVFRDDNGYFHYDTVKAISQEVGDVLWYCAMTLDELGIPMHEVMEGIVGKLQSRQERGTLSGSGDNR